MVTVATVVAIAIVVFRVIVTVLDDDAVAHHLLKYGWDKLFKDHFVEAADKLIPI